VGGRRSLVRRLAAVAAGPGQSGVSAVEQIRLKVRMVVAQEESFGVLSTG